MSYKGTVKNGVVVLESATGLPEGTAVTVEPVTPPVKSDADLDPAFKIGDLAVDIGIPDLSINADHYLYGHPKVTDGR
jgi:hypothetical protein